MNVKHDKEEVLKKGLSLFCQKGYNALGVDEICKVTKMTKGAFYNAFVNKENFLIQALKKYGDVNAERLTKQLSDKTISPTKRLIDLYDFMFEVQPQNQYTGCMVNNIMSELGVNNSIIAETTKDEYSKFLEALIPCITEAQEREELNGEITALQIAELLHSSFYGILTVLKGDKDVEKAKNTMYLLFNTLKNRA